jgi:hypothetical protein
MRNLKVLGMAAVLALAAPVAQASVVYDDAVVGTNGTYSDVGTKSVTFGDVGGTQSISFVLVGGRSVDGFDVGGYDDLFTIKVNGDTVFEAYFNISGGGTDTVVTNLLGWTWTTVKSGGGTFDGGTATISGLVDLIAGLNTFSATFAAVGPSNNGSQGVGDESWALNAVDVSGVTTVPVPATLPLLAAGMAGFGLIRRRK